MKQKSEEEKIEGYVNPNIDFSDIMTDKNAYLSYAEIDKMLNHVLSKKTTPKYTKKIRLRHYLLILMLSRTGRRISEIVGKRPYTLYHGLRPIDIHHDKSLIEWTILKKRPIRTRKSPYSKKRSPEAIARMKEKKKPPGKLQPIDNKTMALLKKFIEINKIEPYDRVFAITRQGAWKFIKEVAEEAGVKRKDCYIHPHMFRHGFSINYLEQNKNDATALVKLQRVLEHSDINITKTYLQFSPEDIQKSLNDLFDK